MTDDVEGCPPSVFEVGLTLKSEAIADRAGLNRIDECSVLCYPAALLIILCGFELRDRCGEGWLTVVEVEVSSALSFVRDRCLLLC